MYTLADDVQASRYENRIRGTLDLSLCSTEMGVSRSGRHTDLLHLVHGALNLFVRQPRVFTSSARHPVLRCGLSIVLCLILSRTALALIFIVVALALTTLLVVVLVVTISLFSVTVLVTVTIRRFCSGISVAIGQVSLNVPILVVSLLRKAPRDPSGTRRISSLIHETQTDPTATGSRLTSSS